MAERINTDECISRVYQFLNKQKDWQKAADINGDGTIIRTEFSAFILNSGFKFNDGENKADLIAAFWKSIDVNVKGKVDISRISNKNALDSSELATVEKNMEAESKVDSFVRTNYVCPSGLETYTQRIREAIKAGILNRAIELLNNGGDISELTDSKLQEFYQSSMNKATADYKAIAMIDEQVKQKYGNDIDYKSADDEVRADIIDDYISQLNGTETQEQVSKDVEAIVNAYMDTAETNSTASTNLLAQYGYDPMDDLNPLQTAVLTKDLTDKILNHLKSTNSDIVTGSFKEQAEAMVKAFVEEYLKDKRADEFSSLKNISASSSEFSSLITDINTAYNELVTARNELNTYIGQILAENDSDKNKIVQEVIGTTNPTQVMNKLLELKTVDEITAKQQELQSRIEALNTTRAAAAEAKAAEDAANLKKLSGLATDTTPFILEDGKAYSINSLLNSSLRSVTIKLSDFEDMSVAITKAMSKIDSISNTIINQLSSVYPSDLLNKAFNTVHNYYYAVLNGIGENGKHDGKLEYAVTYKNELTGSTVIENTTTAHGWAYNHKNIDDVGNIRDESDCDSSSGIYVGYCSGWGYIVHLDMKQFAEKLTSFIPN